MMRILNSEQMSPIDRAAIEASRTTDLLVDALFGTGLSRPLEGFWADLVTAINRLRVPLLAVDLPSGLIAGAEEIPGPCVCARHIVTFLTPHPGEMACLLGITSAEVQRDRRGAARQAAAHSGAIVVLKGHLTLIAAPSGELWVNPTGNPGLATGGSGDLLTGMIAALAAQAVEARAAACAGVFLHGLAGDLCAERTGEVAVLASDLLADLSTAWRQVRRHESSGSFPTASQGFNFDHEVRSYVDYAPHLPQPQRRGDPTLRRRAGRAVAAGRCPVARR